MSKKRIIRVVVGVLMLAALLFCIYRAMLAAPAPEEPAGETETVETEPPAESAEPSASAAPSPTPSPTPEPTPTPLPYTNPLSGEPMEEDISESRPYAIMINNIQQALPQCGVSQAEIVYEIPAEGGVTRRLPIFSTSLMSVKMAIMRVTPPSAGIPGGDRL